MGSILQKLKGGDLRSIGRSEEVVQDILENPALFGASKAAMKSKLLHFSGVKTLPGDLPQQWLIQRWTPWLFQYLEDS